MARADQGDVVFNAIPGYLEATRGFARLQPAALAAPKASQMDAPTPSNAHSNETWSAGSGCAIPQQSRCNCQRHRIRCCWKLSLGSTDLGIALGTDMATDNRQANLADNMRVGKVVPTLTMGHGRPLAQALAEPATPGAQFVQHTAPLPEVAHYPGDPPLVGELSTPPRHQLMPAQIKC